MYVSQYKILETIQNNCNIVLQNPVVLFGAPISPSLPIYYNSHFEVSLSPVIIDLTLHVSAQLAIIVCI
jgi:hypothetical protein